METANGNIHHRVNTCLVAVGAGVGVEVAEQMPKKKGINLKAKDKLKGFFFLLSLDFGVILKERSES